MAPDDALRHSLRRHEAQLSSRRVDRLLAAGLPTGCLQSYFAFGVRAAIRSMPTLIARVCGCRNRRSSAYVFIFVFRDLWYLLLTLYSASAVLRNRLAYTGLPVSSLRCTY